MEKAKISMWLRRVEQHILVVEEEADRVEAMRLEELHVPRDVVLVEPERRAAAALRAEPVDALDVQPLAVGVELGADRDDVEAARLQVVVPRRQRGMRPTADGAARRRART